jgi:3-polyprenyl-4-hydroxybenzoate decarboxylase
LLEHVLERFRPETDLFVFSNVSMDTLDYTSGKVNEGSKAIMLGLGEPVRKRRESLGAVAGVDCRARMFLWWMFSVAGEASVCGRVWRGSVLLSGR